MWQIARIGLAVLFGLHSVDGVTFGAKTVMRVKGEKQDKFSGVAQDRQFEHKTLLATKRYLQC